MRRKQQRLVIRFPFAQRRVTAYIILYLPLYNGKLAVKNGDGLQYGNVMVYLHKAFGNLAQ